MADVQYIYISRTYVTCLSCDLELEEASGGRGIWREARQHADETGHTVWVEQTREFSIEPEEGEAGDDGN